MQSKKYLLAFAVRVYVGTELTRFLEAFHTTHVPQRCSGETGVSAHELRDATSKATRLRTPGLNATPLKSCCSKPESRTAGLSKLTSSGGCFEEVAARSHDDGFTKENPNPPSRNVIKDGPGQTLGPISRDEGRGKLLQSSQGLKRTTTC